ncbi:MAG: class I SAM-dependent methyltransferase [Vicinamibacteria bacterium]
MRQIDDDAIRRHGEIRFRSEYHYALFEYYRSAKILKRLEWEQVPVAGRVLDAGCGSGGIAVSFAEECGLAVGLDIKNKFSEAGKKLASERSIRNAVFVQGDGTELPFESGSFDLVLSHSVIEHVDSAERYLAECHRVLRVGGILFLQTPPYLSFAGSHLSRLRVPIPIHLLLPRSWAFRLNFYIARKRPGWLKEPRESNTFKLMAERGETKKDDLIQRVTVARVHEWLRRAGFDLLREERHVSGFFTRHLPSFLRRFLERSPFTQNVVISNLEFLLRKSKS